jgi:hypothetical protein
MGYGFTSSLEWDTVSQNPVWELLTRMDLQHHTPETLINDVTALQEHLDHYVAHMLA